MAKTPKKLVHWALDPSLSDFGSPFSEGSSSNGDSSSSLQYINSQLIAHGFTHKPGLSLEGTSKEEADRAVKCLLAMLSQRIDDMSRTEELSTKIRTLSYDHERLQSMHRAATEKAANAERETNLHKSRLGSATRTLQTTENAHKQTTVELQRTRTALQAIRSTHATEIKKLEKEKERALDRWRKLADQQIKLGSASSGLRFANAEVVEASDVQLRGKGKGFLEVAAEQAQEARDALFNENRRLKGLLLSAANEIQRQLHNARSMGATESLEEPPVITTVNLFPMASTDAASDKFTSLLSSLRESIEKLREPSVALGSVPAPGPDPEEVRRENERAAKDQQEIDRLKRVVETLRNQLADSLKQTESYAAQTQELFEKLAVDERSVKQREPSVDLMTSPALDEERERLNQISEELEEDRRKFTEAALKLGKEKAALEAERIKFLEEKRSWQIDVMLSHLPPTPDPLPESSEDDAPEEPIPTTEQPRSPRRSAPRTTHSPRKAIAVGNGKRRAVRRSQGGTLGLGPASPKGKSKVIPAFETEVVPPSPSFGGPPAFKTTLSAIPGPSQLQLPPAFVLPPPSPAAQLPPRESLLSATMIPPSADIPRNVPSASNSNSQPETVSTQDSAQTQASGSQANNQTKGSFPPVPSTPSAARPFPLAKPLAMNMIHAYSPVKPSPLSRILLLANSPNSPPGPALHMPPLTEESSSDISPTPAEPVHAHARKLPALSLAAELGLPEEDEDNNPLLDKKPKARSDQRIAAADKGRTKPVSSRTRAAAPLKEKRSKTGSGVVSEAPVVTSKVTGRSVARTAKPAATKTSTVPTTSTVPPPRLMRVGPSKAGPRRVPIDSAEAAPGPKTGWKG